MGPWDAIRNLGDNPLYRWERRRQWRGARPSLVVLGVFCCGCGYLAPYVLAPALAAMAITQDKRARIWDDMLLTALTSEEIVAAKAAAAIQVPAAIVGAQAVLVGAIAAMSAAFGPPEGMQRVLADLAVALPAMAGAALTIGTALVAGCLMGIRAGIRYRSASSAVSAACTGMVILETLVAGGVSVLIGRSAPSIGPVLGGWLLSGATGLSAGFTVVALAAALANALFAAGLWASCVRAARAGDS